MKSHSLLGIRADDWLARLMDAEPTLGELGRIIGETSLALTMMSGVRVTTLLVDTENPDRSIIEFEVGNEANGHRMTVSEFRMRIAQAVFSRPEPWPPLPLPAEPTLDQLQTFIGMRHVLLAPIFGLGLMRLDLADDPDEHKLVIEYTKDGGAQSLGLEDFRSELEDAVFDSIRAQQRGFQLDLDVMHSAMDAHKAGRHPEVVAMLGSMLQPLTALGRSGQIRGVGAGVRGTVTASLLSLARSHHALGDSDSRLETLRTAAHWGEDADIAPRTYLELGRALVDADRAGEGIGFLRRAIALVSQVQPKATAPAEPATADDNILVEAYTELGRAFVARGRKLAAWAAFRRAGIAPDTQSTDAVVVADWKRLSDALTT